MQLPQDFVQQMCSLLGEVEAGALCSALTDTAPAVSVRRNPTKGEVSFAQSTPVPWCSDGCYLAERPSFTLDPRFHAGAYYVQEAASMFIEQAYRQIECDFTPTRLLDLCAAPGGKSTLWRSLLPDGALLVANEPIRQRAQILAENLTKWGHPDVVTTSAYPAEFAPLRGFFDVIAADVPCSGEGMFRKDEGARAEWSLAAVETCAARQRAILTDIWDCLREGGYLVYSTCTFNRAENEDNVRFVCQELGAEVVAVPIDEAWGIAPDTTAGGQAVYHFFPHRTQGEGLFLALLRKTGSAPAAREKKRTRSKETPVPDAAKLLAWLKTPTDFRLFRLTPETIAAVRTPLLDDVQRVAACVRTLTAGVLMGETKGRKFVPAHALALSTVLADTAFPRAELDRDTALRYLRREAVVLPPEQPRGHVLLCFEGLPLGWVNNLGTRANNLYPAEWRIRNV